MAGAADTMMPAAHNTFTYSTFIVTAPPIELLGDPLWSSTARRSQAATHAVHRHLHLRYSGRRCELEFRITDRGIDDLILDDHGHAHRSPTLGRWPGHRHLFEPSRRLIDEEVHLLPCSGWRQPR